MTGVEEQGRLASGKALTRRINAEPPPANSSVGRVGRRFVLFAHPNPNQFGHQAYESAFALAYARRFGLPVFFSWPEKVSNEWLFEVEAADVHVLRSCRERFLPRLILALSGATERIREWRRRIVNAAREEMTKDLRDRLRDPNLPRQARMRVKSRLEAMRVRHSHSVTELEERRRAGGFTYNRRRLLIEPLATRLTEWAERLAQKQASEFGLDAESRVVTLHQRERGYKLGLEMQDKGGEGSWDDSVRNSRIETCVPAIDYLVQRGYTVVRLGDAMMTPLTRPGVVDLAAAADRDTGLLQLWALFQSKFLISAESGPLSATYLTNTPLLTINATDPIGAFPIRPDGLYLLKTIIDRETGEPLLPTTLLTREHLMALRAPDRHQFMENTAEQIFEAVQEMLDLLERRPPETPGQTWYRELVTEVAANVKHQYARKHGADRGYMGYGRLVRSLADRWFELEPQSAHPRLPLPSPR